MTKRPTGPLNGIFTKSPEMIADILSSKEFFSGGAAGGLRVLTVYIAYAGRRMSTAQRHSLERAKEMLIDRTRVTAIANEKAQASQVRHSVLA